MSPKCNDLDLFISGIAPRPRIGLNRSHHLLTRGLSEFLCCRFDRSNQIPSLRFRHNRRNPRVNGRFLQPFRVQHREQNQRYIRIQCRHPLRRFDAVDVRHRQVDQHDVRFNPLKLSNPGTPGFRFAANCPISRPRNYAQNPPRRLAIINNQNSHWPGAPHTVKIFAPTPDGGNTVHSLHWLM